MTIRSPEQAIEYAELLQRTGHNIGRNNCLIRVREAFGVDAIGDFDGDGSADAEDAWKRAKLRHRIDDVAGVPRGVPVYWVGGSNDNGHVAISMGAGWCMSPGTPDDPEHWGLVRISAIAQRWGGLTLAGWSEDLNGVTVWTRRVPAPKPPTPPARPSRGENVDAALRDLQRAAQRSAGNPRRTRLITAARTALRKIGRVR